MELSKTYKVEYLCSATATEGLNTAKMMILGDNEKMNDFVKVKNFLLLNDGCLDSGKKHTHRISTVKSIGEKKKPKKSFSAKKIITFPTRNSGPCHPIPTGCGTSVAQPHEQLVPLP